MAFLTLQTREVCFCMYGGVRLMRTDLDGARGELISATAIRGKREKLQPKAESA
jgi:hypothetical protein